MSIIPLVTIVVPSYNQGNYLHRALASIFEQKIPVEVYVIDGGSTDDSINIIHQWAPQLSGWRSHADKGQAAAINEGIARGTAPFVCWLNSDDELLPGSLAALIEAMHHNPSAPLAYGRAWNFYDATQTFKPVWVEPFDEHRLALRCIISQPATLMRRSAWEGVGGVNENLHMVMDYDLWWRLFKKFGPFTFIDKYLGLNREHVATKTNTQRKLHYQEAMRVVKKYYGRLPLKWWLLQPYAVWFRSWIGTFER